MTGTSSARARLLHLLVWLGVLAASAAATRPAPAGQTIYVNDLTGNDAWSGLCEVWDGGTCGPKKTIKAGIQVAANGDTILVADGTYKGINNRNLDFAGKAIVVRSVNGAQACTIDCENVARAMRFHSGETHASVLQGFSITNGKGDDGGGIQCSGASPVIRDCTVSASHATHNGGGIWVYGSTALIEGCTILNNSADYAGGGLLFEQSAATVRNCTLIGNVAVCDYY